MSKKELIPNQPPTSLPKSLFAQARWDIGLLKLLPEWKKLLSKKYLLEDTFAGITVACIAIPLSLAIALASGVKPEVGLITAIVAGIVAAMFGGTPLAVTGPAAAMSILIAAEVEKFGLSGLLFICLLVGLFQVLSGVLGFGKLARYVPSPVIAGFTAGIGAIIIIGQLPRALGLPAPDQSHVFEVLTHIKSLIDHMHPEVFVVTLLSIAIMRGMPKILPRWPAPLFAVIIPTIAVAALNLTDVPLLGDLPRTLPSPKFPDILTSEWGALLNSAFVVFFLASVETLLSSSAVDKLSKTDKHDPDQELIGQGLANVAVSFFGGIPATGVIARSAVNVRSGGRTRRSAIFHSLALLAAVGLFAPLIGRIPVAALAGILLSVAASMLDWSEFRNLWRLSKQEAGIYLVTFATIIFVDLVAGIQAGVVVTALIGLLTLAQTKVFLNSQQSSGPIRLSISGALTFLSYAKIERLERELRSVDCSKGVIIDLAAVSSMDSTGASFLTDFVKNIQRDGVEVVLKGVALQYKALLAAQDEAGDLPPMKVAENEIFAQYSAPNPDMVRDRLLHGVEIFREEFREDHRGMFEQLAVGQDPHTLFITCADSRVNPNLITSTDLGELLVLRNVGNMIPPFNAQDDFTEGAAVEFAVSHLNVASIIICGHSGCGAIKATLADAKRPDTVALNKVLDRLSFKSDLYPAGLQADEAAKINVLRQVRNLMTYPGVRERVKMEKLVVFAWFYEVGSREVLEWDHEQEVFVPIKAKARQKAPAWYAVTDQPGVPLS